MSFGTFVTIGLVNHTFGSDFTVTTLVSLVPRFELSHHPAAGYPAGGDAMWETVASTSLWVLHIYCNCSSTSSDCTHLIYHIMQCLKTCTTRSSGSRVCVCVCVCVSVCIYGWVLYKVRCVWARKPVFHNLCICPSCKSCCHQKPIYCGINTYLPVFYRYLLSSIQACTGIGTDCSLKHPTGHRL